MKLRDFYDKLTEMIDNDTDLLDCDVIYSVDDEGSCFHPSTITPAVYLTNKVGYDMDARSRTGLMEEGEYVDDYIKVICIN